MYYIIKYKTHDNMSSCQKVIVFAKFPKKGIAFGGAIATHGFAKKGQEKERTRKGKGLFVVWDYFLNKWVSLE